MKKMKNLVVSLCVMTGMIFGAAIADAKVVLEDIKLPEPNVTGGMPIMEAFKNRHSSTKFTSKKEIPLQVLSDMLWAADGINRPDGKRTAPSALNAQVITIYAALDDGIYKYDPKMHNLVGFSKEDIRPIVGTKAPLILLYVANLSRQSKALASVDCGFIGQNVYLFSAANGLNTIFLYGVNSSALNYKLELKLGEEVLFAQVVGYGSDK